MAAALELDGVTKRYGAFTAVDHLSFTHAPGRIMGFLGPNGAGKTTTLRMLLGLITPDEGRLRILGEPLSDAIRARIGYLPEERGLYKRMRAQDAIAYLAVLKGLSFAEARKRAKQLMEEFGLGPQLCTRIDALSKGMAQKVALIAALAHDPELLILDEPFSGLDPISQQSLEGTIRGLAASGKTILFSTHTMAQAERLCEQLVILAKGKKVFDGSLDDARRVLPRRARIAADGDLSFLRALPGVAALSPPAPGRAYWEADLREGADGAALLKACFDRNILPTRFEVADANLQDVFVALAGHQEAA